MPRPPQRPRGHRPSPLQQVVHLRPLSSQPEDMAVRDPMFWKRFSAAIHTAEGLDEEKCVASPASVSSSGTTEKSKNDWLLRQHQKKRRCRIIAWSVAVSVALAIVAIAVVAWYFTAGPGKAKDTVKGDV